MKNSCRNQQKNPLNKNLADFQKNMKNKETWNWQSNMQKSEPRSIPDQLNFGMKTPKML